MRYAVTPAVSRHILCAALSGMHIQEWLRSLRPGSGIKGSDLEDLWNLLPSLPLSSSLSSLSLSPSSLLGLGALASLTVYWLVTRPRPMRPPCDLQAQSVAVDVSGDSKCVCLPSCVYLTPWLLRWLQGDPSCRRSALLADDSLLEFYYDDTRTFYDMFQRGLRIAGRTENTHSVFLFIFFSHSQEC